MTLHLELDRPIIFSWDLGEKLEVFAEISHFSINVGKTLGF